MLTKAAYNEARRDVVIMAITSRVRPAAPHEALIQDWQAAGLLKSSVMKGKMNGVRAGGKAG